MLKWCSCSIWQSCQYPRRGVWIVYCSHICIHPSLQSRCVRTMPIWRNDAILSQFKSHHDFFVSLALKCAVFPHILENALGFFIWISISLQYLWHNLPVCVFSILKSRCSCKRYGDFSLKFIHENETNFSAYIKIFTHLTHFEVRFI